MVIGVENEQTKSPLLFFSNTLLYVYAAHVNFEIEGLGRPHYNFVPPSIHLLPAVLASFQDLSNETNKRD